jgi:BirA family biotin operon repressor/biotin-[acetyl-CoA-carboxylase] ligase
MSPDLPFALDAAAVSSHCRGAAAGVAIEVVAETGSTNADLLARVTAPGGLAGPVLLSALHQTAGRGRAGRSWLSAPGSTLMFSLAWKLGGPLNRLAGLPLAVGVALAESLAALEVPVALKWPNDLMKDGSKLAGILVETRDAPVPGDGIWAVIGVGINLLMPQQLESDIGRTVAAAPWLARMDRNALLAALLNSLAAALQEFDGAGFAAFSERWNRCDAYRGEPVVILENGIVLHEGTAAGVDATGRLQLDTGNGRIAILSGDVSLRPAAPAGNPGN